MRQIALYCASSSKLPEAYVEAAREVGREMGRRGLTMVNGAGNMGLMQEAADACLAAGGRVVGVIPTFMIAEGWAHEGLSELIETPTMEARKAKIETMTDGAIVLPGGIGTMDEFFEIITLKQLGLYLGPVVLLNTDGYYDQLLAFLRRAIREGFMREVHAATFKVCATPMEAIDLVENTPAWDKDIRRLAKI